MLQPIASTGPEKYVLSPRSCGSFDEGYQSRRAELRIETDWAEKECGCASACVTQFHSKARRSQVNRWRAGWASLSLPDRHECLMRFYDTYGNYSAVTVCDADEDADQSDDDGGDIHAGGWVRLQDRDATSSMIAEVSDPKKVVVKDYRSAWQCSRNFRINLIDESD